jgi:two-component system cell cycle response regulator
MESAEILIVEDSLTQAMHLQYVLQEAGYAVRVARNGALGLASAQAERPTVIISDVMMPEMNGFDFCARIKQDPALKEIPVVLLTSLSDPRDVIRGMQCGADSFLTKPFVPEQLLRRVHQILVNATLRKEGAAQLSVEVFFAGQRHILTPDRMQLLDLLLSTFEAAVLQNTHLEKTSRDLREALAAVVRVQANFRTVMEMSGDAIVVVDARHLVRYVNPAAETLFGRPADDFLHRPFGFPIQGGRQELTITRPDGSRVVGDMRTVDSNWDGENVRLATIRDITETVLLRERLETESVTDALTGLHNRRGFVDHSNKQLRLAARMGRQVVCLYADLDGFKIVNDTLGHEEGDRVLCHAATVLRQTFRDSDVIGRVGGDEFAVLALQSGPGAAETLVTRLQEAIARHNASPGQSHPLAMSIGAAITEIGIAVSLTELMTRADKLMYEQKAALRSARAAAASR